MQVNALFKKFAPAPATKTATKTVKKSAPVKKTVAPPKAKPAPVKKFAAKKVGAPRKAAPTKVAKGDALAKWYGTYACVRAFPGTEKESFVRSRSFSRGSRRSRNAVRLRLRRDRIGNSAMHVSKGRDREKHQIR